MKLKMDGICKSFGSNEVLKSVGFQLSEGEICALLGENLPRKPGLGLSIRN